MKDHIMRIHRSRLLILLPFLSFCDLPSVFAQQVPASQPSAPTVASTTEITVQAIQNLKKQAEEATNLDKALKTRLLDSYEQAIQQTRTAEKWADQAATFDKAMQDAPGLLSALQEELAQPIPDATPEVQPEWSLSQLEQFLAQAEAELAEAQRRLAELESEASQRVTRRTQLPGLTAKAREQLDELTTRLAAPIPSEGTPELINAARLLLLARKKATEQEITAYEKEVLSYDARGKLLTVQRDHAARRVAHLERRGAAWRALVADRRRIEAEEDAQKARKAEREAATKHPVLQSLAEENAELAGRRTGLTDSIEKAAKQLDQVNATLTAIRAQFHEMRARLDTAGLTHGVGLLLRNQRADLPDLHHHRSRIRARESELSSVQLEWFERRSERSSLIDIDTQVRQALAKIEVTTDRERGEIAARVQELLQTRRDYLQALISDYDTCLVTLISLNTKEQALIDQVASYRNFIDEHILWIRSARFLRLSDIPTLWDAFRWLTAPTGWGALLRTLWLDAAAEPLFWALFVVLFAALLYKRRTFRANLERTNDRVRSRRLSDTYGHTIEALVYALLMSATWPLLPWFLAWRLSSSAGASEFPLAAAAGLQMAAVILLTLDFLRYLCRADGLGEIHFRWHLEVLSPIRRNIDWITAFVVPLSFFFFILEEQSTREYKGTLGRLLFIAYAIALTAFVWRTLRPLARLPASSTAASTSRRLFRLCYPVALFLSVSLTALALFGYYYTALQLNWRFALTAWLIIVLILVNGLVQRWLLLAHRALAIREARRRLAAKQSEADTDRETRSDQASLPRLSQSDKAPLPQLSESDLDLSAINVQTRTLVRSFFVLAMLVGVWLIWVDMLPALEFLDRVKLWENTVEVAETTTAVDGTTTVHMVERPQPVTLKSLLITLVVLAMTVISAKNIPGLLEMALLQRLPMQSGSRYALTTVARYLIGVVGFVAACKVLGIAWSSVQWLIAAMTVGLGFGLQEIFANFVSGLIILFERPVRLGDTITVGDVSGTVTRIRIRATTITDWDRKELIVPNKEFITGRLINWSLSDEVLRLVIQVGIAYGSDIDLAHKILYQVARDNPNVLDHPHPHVVFDEFGDSTLNFTLRVYIPNVDVILKVRDELNTAIDAAFREAGIEIAFPQQDIYIRSIEKPLSVVDRGE